MGCGASSQVVPVSPSTVGHAEDVKPQPVTPDSRVLRGQAYYAAGKVAEALKELNATIATWPAYARAYLERGNVRLDQKEYPQAVGDYTMALQLQANLLQAYVMRCHARLALRQYSEALADVREAERLDPDNAQVRALKVQVRRTQQGGGGGGGGGGPPGAPAGLALPLLGAEGGGAGGGAVEEDAFAGVDTPKSTPSPSVRKLCMVCMDVERECRLRPCMHAALCVECAEGLMARGYGCPICSTKIEQLERGAFMRTFTVEEAQGIAAAGARVAAGSVPSASPGRSPLGRRMMYGTLGSSTGAAAPPSLANIAEGDETDLTHASNASGAARRSGGGLQQQASGGQVAGQGQGPAELPGSTGAGGEVEEDGGVRPGTPPVQLVANPIARRASGAGEGSVGASGGSGGGPVERGTRASAGGGGAARSLGSQLEAAATGEQQQPQQEGRDGTVEEEPGVGVGDGHGSRGPSPGGSGGSFSCGSSGACTAGGGGGGSGGGDGAWSVGALSPGTSAYAANSLADWMDEDEMRRLAAGGGSVGGQQQAEAGERRAPGSRRSSNGAGSSGLGGRGGGGGSFVGFQQAAAGGPRAVAEGVEAGAGRCGSARGVSRQAQDPRGRRREQEQWQGQGCGLGLAVQGGGRPPLPGAARGRSAYGGSVGGGGVCEQGALPPAGSVAEAAVRVSEPRSAGRGGPAGCGGGSGSCGSSANSSSSNWERRCRSSSYDGEGSLPPGGGEGGAGRSSSARSNRDNGHSIGLSTAGAVPAHVRMYRRCSDDAGRHHGALMAGVGAGRC